MHIKKLYLILKKMHIKKSTAITSTGDARMRHMSTSLPFVPRPLTDDPTTRKLQPEILKTF